MSNGPVSAAGNSRWKRASAWVPLAALIGVGAVIFTHDSRTRPENAVLPQAPAIPPATAAPQLLRPEPESPRDSPTANSSDPAPLGTAIIEPAKATDFDAKYAGKSTAEILEALARIMPQHRAERKRLIDERWDLGLYDSVFVPEGAERPAMPTLPDGTQPTFGFKTEPSAGGTLVMTTTLGPEEYPEFTHMEMELRWLRAKARSFPMSTGAR